MRVNFREGQKKPFFWLVFLFVSSCAPIPDHEFAGVAESCDCDAVAVEALETGVFAVGDWPGRTWWKEFGDPVLDELIEAALRESPTLKAAEERLKAASQIALQRRAALFPEIDLSMTDNWQHLARYGFFRAFAPLPAEVNDINLDFTFSYEFDFWGKYRDLFNAALGDAAAEAAEKMQAELILTTSIAYTYAEMQFLLYKRQILEKQERNRADVSATREKRAQFALDTSLQHLFTRANTLDVGASITEVDPLIQEQVHRLKALSGLGQDAAIEIRFKPLNPLQTTLPERLSLDLIGRRPDLIAQKARVEAAAKRIDAAKTDFYPNVNLMAFIGLESVFWSKLFRKENYSGSFEPALTLPIFTAGRLKAQLMEKVAEFNQAVFIYNDLILKAAQEIADSLTTIASLQREIGVREVSLEVADRQRELTAKRVQHALDDRITYLDAENVVLDKELTLASLEYGKQLAAILLIRGLGGGYHD